MSLSITTQLDAIYFSASLPEEVNITVANENASVKVELYIDNTKEFETTLFAYGYYVKFCDIRTIIEDTIRDNNNACADCYIKVIEGSTNVTSSHFEVVMSQFAIGSPATYLLSHFLTTRTAFRISRTGKQTLSWFSYQGETITAKVNKIIENTVTGVSRMQEVSQTAPTASTDGVLSYTFTVEDMESGLNTNEVLRGFTIQRGNRYMNFYITDETPDLTMLFLNGFNVPEYAEFYAKTKVKQKVERTEAICQRQYFYYDHILEQTHEVETSLLTYEEAEWLKQFCYSRYVALKMDANTNKEVLITESTPEISDDKNAKNRLKFTWKFAKDTQYM